MGHSHYGVHTTLPHMTTLYGLRPMKLPGLTSDQQKECLINCGCIAAIDQNTLSTAQFDKAYKPCLPWRSTGLLQHTGYHCSKGMPKATSFLDILSAVASNALHSAGVSRQPSAPAASSACLAFLAPAMRTHTLHIQGLDVQRQRSNNCPSEMIPATPCLPVLPDLCPCERPETCKTQNILYAIYAISWCSH